MATGDLLSDERSAPWAEVERDACPPADRAGGARCGAVGARARRRDHRARGSRAGARRFADRVRRGLRPRHRGAGAIRPSARGAAVDARARAAVGRRRGKRAVAVDEVAARPAAVVEPRDRSGGHPDHHVDEASRQGPRAPDARPGSRARVGGGDHRRRRRRGEQLGARRGCHRYGEAAVPPRGRDGRRRCVGAPRDVRVPTLPTPIIRCSPPVGCFARSPGWQGRGRCHVSLPTWRWPSDRS